MRDSIIACPGIFCVSKILLEKFKFYIFNIFLNKKYFKNIPI
jgi:hypothetical protein